MKNSIVFTIAFTLVFYSTGASFIEGFVNYTSWHLIGAREFSTYHKFITPRVLVLLVAPMLLGTVFSVLMLWFRPPSIPMGRMAGHSASGCGLGLLSNHSGADSISAQRRRSINTSNQPSNPDQVLAPACSLRHHGSNISLDDGGHTGQTKVKARCGLRYALRTAEADDHALIVCASDRFITN
jgi:hypothetical protein